MLVSGTVGPEGHKNEARIDLTNASLRTTIPIPGPNTAVTSNKLDAASMQALEAKGPVEKLRATMAAFKALGEMPDKALDRKVTEQLIEIRGGPSDDFMKRLANFKSPLPEGGNLA